MQVSCLLWYKVLQYYINLSIVVIGSTIHHRFLLHFHPFMNQCPSVSQWSLQKQEQAIGASTSRSRKLRKFPTFSFPWSPVKVQILFLSFLYFAMTRECKLLIKCCNFRYFPDLYTPASPFLHSFLHPPKLPSPHLDLVTLRRTQHSSCI